jgi:hypothetical protein
MIGEPDKCLCEMLDRAEPEQMRDWLKRCMCWHHWQQSDYYQGKTNLRRTILTGELMDLITLMPDSQTQEIIDYIMELRRIKGYRDDDFNTVIQCK